MNTPVSGPNYSLTEERQEQMGKALWREVWESDQPVQGMPRPYDDMPIVELWDTSDEWQRHLASGMRRGRTVLEAIRYGEGPYWRLDYRLFFNIDEEANAGVHRAARNGAVRLLQLVALSQAPIYYTNANWNLPRGDDIFDIVTEMQHKAGVAEAWDMRTRDPNVDVSDMTLFPGLTDKDIVRMILTGELPVGNDQQPDPVCYHNP